MGDLRRRLGPASLASTSGGPRKILSYGVTRLTHMYGPILRGARPSDNPVEQATKVHRAINIKTAKALGLTVPPSLLALADEVIE